MVGVPGRSKGCSTCRKRRKGCDQVRPACGQCLKAGLECAGYHRPRIFVHATGGGAGTRNSQAVVLPAGAAVRDARGGNAIATTAAIESDSLTRSAYEVRYLELFWDTYLPLQKDLDKQMTYVNPPWTEAAYDLYPSDNALRTALLALGLSTLGRRDGQRWMVEEGLNGYVRSLRQMSEQLRKPHGWKSDAVLAASKALGLYELLHGGNSTPESSVTRAESWQSHNAGELALIIQRSPNMHSEGNARLLFINSRMHLIIYCIVKRQRCPLSTREWKSIPFKDMRKSHKDSLLDILADIPGILEDLDHLRSSVLHSSRSLGHHEQAATLAQKCWRLDRELTGWSGKHSPQSQIDRLLERRSREEAPILSDVATAHIMGIYWAACILVYSTLRSALAMHRGSEQDSLPERTELGQYCRQIADIAEVLLHPSAGIFGLHSLPLPVGVALVCVRSMAEGCYLETEKRRLMDLFETNGGRARGVKDFLFSCMTNFQRL